MRYDPPRLLSLNPLGTVEAACMSGSNPPFTPCSCEAGGNPSSQGNACQGGCAAGNKCTYGTSAGFSGQPQGCEMGIGARENPKGTGCTTGEGVTDSVSPTTGGCVSGYTAAGCSTGNNRFIP